MLGFEWPLWVNIVVFAVSWLVIGYVGYWLAEVSDLLSERTGIGGGMMGAVFLALSTSLPGLIVSVLAGFAGRAELAISNAVGGIAGQTFFLVIADLFFRRSNLEHAADEVSNLITAALLMALLSGTLVGGILPGWNLRLGVGGESLMQVDPITPLLIGGYIAGIYLSNESRERPQWTPVASAVAPREAPAEKSKESLRRLWVRFGIYALITAGVGFGWRWGGQASARRRVWGTRWWVHCSRV